MVTYFTKIFIMMYFFVMLMWLHPLLTYSKEAREKIHFEYPSANHVRFPEGVTLEMYCITLDSTDAVEIRSPNEVIVEGSNLVKGKTQKYDFQILNSTACVFVIEILSRNDEGAYYCQEGVKTNLAQIHVLYSPSDKSPLCSANYDSPVIFDDLRQDYINFTCITEKGKPAVLMTLNIFSSKNTRNITDIANICTAHQNYPSSRSFFCHMDQSLENTTFVCNVSQQFPSPYNDSYQDSCFFGPLHFLTNFSISLSPSNVTVNEGDDVTLSCTTNVTGVAIEWINIPEDWKYVKSLSEYTSNLEIYDVSQQLTSAIIVQCIGSYGDRRMGSSSKIIVEGKSHVAKIVIPICLSFCIICIIIFVIRLYARKNRCSFPSLLSDNRLSKEAEVDNTQMNDTTSRSNKNNANNTSIEVAYDEGSSGMLENPVYESASPVVDESF